MSDEVMDEEVVTSSRDEQIDSAASIVLIETTFEKFLETADVKKAFGEPVDNGDAIIIPAAEVVTSMGFGSGFGSSGNEGGGGGGGGGHTL